MRIGILTFHASCNYGGVLQAFCLQKALSSLGHSVDVVDYRSSHTRLPAFWEGWRPRTASLTHAQRRFRGARIQAATQAAFDAFRMNHMQLSERCDDHESLARVAAGYDAIVVGSDQVWCFDRDSAYFLEWGRDYSGRRISFAPCCVRRQQRADRTPLVAEWLKRMDFMSVRNTFSQEAIHDAIGISPPIVVDPTLLINTTIYETCPGRPRGKFALIYALGAPLPGDIDIFLKKAGEKYGFSEVWWINGDVIHPSPWPQATKHLWAMSPQHWMWLHSNASFVLTDSFHGALFAIKAKTPFVAYYAEEPRASRFVDLAHRYHVGPWIAWDSESALASLTEDIDFEQVHATILAHVSDSFQYLNRALS